VYDIPCLCEKFKKDKTELSQLSIVREFSDIFSDELSRLTSERKVEVSIDILPGTSPITHLPYRMTSAKLIELKIQFQELLNKRFICSSNSLWGALILFVKKNYGTLGL
jgi:hypothetical protein